jgi:tetratricopeptide (TPR) repeat protein
MGESADIAPESAGHTLEQGQVFSRSLLWDLQQRYFDGRGVEAWRASEVPHYVSSNPTMADAYAEIVLAFLVDRERLAPADEASGEPLHLLELGAGSGRFACHFLTRLVRLCERAGVAPERFRYVLTDRVEANLAFWEGHPSLQPFFERGLLDRALFDLGETPEVALRRRSEVLGSGSLGRPLVVIANYLFDSVPQDLFVLAGGACRQGLVSLAVDEDPAGLDAGELLARLRCDVSAGPPAESPYEEPWLCDLLEEYRAALAETHLLFPALGLRGLARLRSLSRAGLLLLSADHGEHRLAALDGLEPPQLFRHGSFSLPVNYHAIGAWVSREGGLPLFPQVAANSLVVSCCLLTDRAGEHGEVRRAFERRVRDFGPDDYFTVVGHAWKTQPEMSKAALAAYLRLGLYDSHLLARLLPRWLEVADELDMGERAELCAALDQAWEGYFPLGEDIDLARQIAELLYAIDEYRGALGYFRRSVEIYGPDTGTLYNMAVCHSLLGEEDRALPLLQALLAHDPENEAARGLLAELEGR